MKKFTFRLDSLLSLRKTEERKLQEIVSKRQKEILDLQGVIQFLNENLKKSHEPFLNDPTNFLGTAFLQQQDMFQLGVQIQIEKVQLAIQKRKKLLKKEMQAFLEAKIKVKILEKLKEKHLEDYKIEYEKKNQKIMDDLSLMRNRLREGKEYF